MPIGDLLVQATAVHGRPNSEALAALNIDAANSRPVWLNVKLQQESRWTGRLFDLDEWEETADLSSIVSRTVAIDPNEEATITVESP